jgi:multidrug efflux pump subunit AcrB
LLSGSDPRIAHGLSQIENLYVGSSQENVKVPLLSIATLKDILETARIRRCEHFRTLSILCFPAPGALASEVLAPIEPKLIALKNSLPPGYQLQIGGEKAKQVEGFTNRSADFSGRDLLGAAGSVQ